MLWFDNSQSSFEVKLQKAVEYYKVKYSRTPDLCLVHPSTAKLPQGKSSAEMCGLTVRLYRPVLPGHIWVGIQDKE
jgi:hypothetical protein